VSLQITSIKGFPLINQILHSLNNFANLQSFYYLPHLPVFIAPMLMSKEESTLNQQVELSAKSSGAAPPELLISFEEHLPHIHPRS